MSLIAELKRRSVVRVAVAYGIVGWLLAQVADLLFGTFGTPDWALQTFVIVLFLGFPVALLLAWAFELTPEGIKRESSAETDQPAEKRSGRKLDLFIIGVLALAVVFLLFDRFVLSDRVDPGVQSTTELQPSIAVLPFDNRSANADDEFFVDGIHDDILTQLARIQSLKVISRTSVMEYRDSIRNIREIGRELDVATILEGGVQRAGDSVRINVQLIDAGTDEHLWAETYDRQLNTSNIFEIQSEIAAAVARALHTTLSPELESAIGTAPTDNLQAYDAFQQANAILARSISVSSSKAAALFQEAVLLDPSFALAYVKLAQIYVNHYWFLGKKATNMRRAKAALDTALNLVPDMPEALIVLADYHYKVFLDYDRALELLDDAIPRAPQLSVGIVRRAFILRRTGRFDESIAEMEKALKLDPLSGAMQYGLAQTLAMVGRYEEAGDYYDRGIALTPDVYTVHAARAYNLCELDPDSSAIRDLLNDPKYSDSSSLHWVLFRWRMALLERDYEIAMATLSRSKSSLLDINQVYYPVDLMTGLTEHFLGDRKAARPLFESAKADLEKARESSPDDFLVQRALALAYAGLGEAERAKLAADAAVALLPISRDSILGPEILLNRARTLAMIGEDDAALEDLRTLMSVPLNWMAGPVVMRKDPAFQHLHTRPEFQALFDD